jgi:hypothetical protein
MFDLAFFQSSRLTESLTSFLHSASAASGLASIALFSSSSLLLPFLLFVSSQKASREHKIVPSQLPWVGKIPTQLFASIRANYRGLVDSVDLYTAGYRKVLKASPLQAFTDDLINPLF